MAQQPSPLDLSLVQRKGEARPSSPEEVVGQGRGLVPAEPAPAPAESAPAMTSYPEAPLRPAARPQVQRVAVSMRLPIAAAAGLKAMAYYTGEGQQDIVERLVLQGLDAWRHDWRTMIPEQQS